MALKATKISNDTSDNFRIMKGKLITSADGDGDYIAFELPKNCFIRGTFVDIKTAYTASSTGTLTVGIKEPGVAISASQLAADTVTLSEAVGLKTITQAAYLPNGGVLTIGIVKGDSAANIVVHPFVEYSVII
jgi:hypothetical protein